MKHSSRIGTIALIVRLDKDTPCLIDALSDDHEISVLESAVRAGEEDPLQSVYVFRKRQLQEDEEFGDYVEELLSQPFLRPEIQEHGVQWLRSKIRIEQFQKSEREATRVISEYAYRIFQESPWRTEFFLSGPTAKVKVRVYMMPGVNGAGSKPSSRAS